MEGLRSRGRAYLGFPQEQGEGYVQEPIVSESAPFFHIDLIAAVRAAEKLGLKAERQGGGSGMNGQSRDPQDDTLIDLHN